jgi:hypothetical protein
VLIGDFGPLTLGGQGEGQGQGPARSPSGAFFQRVLEEEKETNSFDKKELWSFGMMLYQLATRMPRSEDYCRQLMAGQEHLQEDVLQKELEDKLGPGETPSQLRGLARVIATALRPDGADQAPEDIMALIPAGGWVTMSVCSHQLSNVAGQRV